MGWCGELTGELANRDRDFTARAHIADSEGSARMAFRTNYRFERAERDRIKKAKKEEKLKQ